MATKQCNEGGMPWAMGTERQSWTESEVTSWGRRADPERKIHKSSNTGEDAVVRIQRKSILRQMLLRLERVSLGNENKEAKTLRGTYFT